MALNDVAADRNRRSRGGSILYDPRFRGIVAQILLTVLVIGAILWLAGNAIQNLRRANIASGFDFLGNRAGFEISQTLIPYSIESTYARAFFVGLLNTLLVAVIGIIFASIIGFLLGIARLSRNWIVAKLATVYIETLRNIPVLLQLVFWYKAVLSVLPGPRQGYMLPFGANLSNRGLILPSPIPHAEFNLTIGAFLVGLLIAIVLSRWATRRQLATGKRPTVLWLSMIAIVCLPLVVFLASGRPLDVSYPELKGFNFVGGLHIAPELIALLLGLVLYTATYIGEIVRAGMLAVARGQTEAASALGLRHGRTLRLVVVPQALRVIIPPLTSQYLNLIKNSSLAVAVGYPDLVSVFSATVMNQTGQAVEVIFITMMVYLGISLLTSVFMNWFNSRVALVER